MAEGNYWLDLFTGTTWQQFLDAGGEVSGFREGRWKTVQKIKPGDVLLCYLTGLSRWVGLLEVTSEPFKDDAPIWGPDEFPCRVRVRILSALTPETAVPVLEMRDHLSVFKGLKNPHNWSGAFRGSPAKWRRSDGEAVAAAVQAAERDPVSRPIDKAKLGRRPRALQSGIGEVTVPEEMQVREEGTTAEVVAADASTHTEIQWLLLKLGRELGVDVWVARNDRSRVRNGRALSEQIDVRDRLPHQFDPATQKVIELIDVLWLDGNSIVAAFEVESTTSIYSGLLRMADLVSMQPNLQVPLFIVAPDDRRDRVIQEVNRPTFSSLKQPLVEVCRYISFSALTNYMAQVAPHLRYMKPEVLQEWSESCEPEEP